MRIYKYKNLFIDQLNSEYINIRIYSLINLSRGDHV
jgi:hypothetical protein